MKILTDDEIKKYTSKYKFDIYDCLNNINHIKKIAKDINCDTCKEVKILKSVEDITSEGLLKCAK